MIASRFPLLQSIIFSLPLTLQPFSVCVYVCVF